MPGRRQLSTGETHAHRHSTGRRGWRQQRCRMLPLGMPRVVRLLVILAPGSVDAEVGRLQQAIFASRGLVSAIALPPLVPVRFLPPDGPGRIPDPPGREVPSRWRAAATTLVEADDSLFLGLDTRGAWHGLHSDLRYRPGRPGGGLFSEAEGFFLGCPGQEQSAEPRPGVDEPAVPVLAFSSASLAIFRIKVPEAGPWWTDLSWEIEDRRPLRGRRPG